MDHLNEVDALKLALLKERSLLLNSELARLQGELRALAEKHNAHQHEYSIFVQGLKKNYQLSAGDELLDDGSIKRAHMRAIKEEAHK